MSNPINIPIDRHANYISLTLVERTQLKAAIVAHSGTVKAFAAKHTFAGAYSSLSQVLNGDKRICPKALAKLRVTLGIES